MKVNLLISPETAEFPSENLSVWKFIVIKNVGSFLEIKEKNLLSISFAGKLICFECGDMLAPKAAATACRDLPAREKLLFRPLQTDFQMTQTLKKYG